MAQFKCNKVNIYKFSHLAGYINIQLIQLVFIWHYDCPRSHISDEDEDRCLLGKVPLLVLPVFITSLSPPLVILLVERIKRSGLCVTMAMTSLCHFCEHPSGCKSAAEDCPHPPSPLRPIHWRSSPATAAFPTCSAARSLSPSSPMSLVIHTTQHHSEAPWAVGESACSVWNAMWFSGPTCFNCTVWFNWRKKGVKESVCERVQVWVWNANIQRSLKVFGQWVIYFCFGYDHVFYL